MTDRMNGAMLLAIAVGLALGAGPARAQTSPPAPGPSPSSVSINAPLPAGSNAIGSVGLQANGAPVAPSNALPTADANNAAISGSSVLVPGTPVSVTTAGFGFGWMCTTAGTGTITLSDNSTVPYNFFTNSGGMSRDVLKVINVSPGTASGCTFWNFR